MSLSCSLAELSVSTPAPLTERWELGNGLVYNSALPFLSSVTVAGLRASLSHSFCIYKMGIDTSFKGGRVT
jgi:hypothetical protein